MTTPISGVGAALGAARSTMDPHGPGVDLDDGSFADSLKRALGNVNDLQIESRDAIGAFLRGDDVELHDVMAAAEEAGLAVEMLVEVRNKIVDAYRTLVNMQG